MKRTPRQYRAQYRQVKLRCLDVKTNRSKIESPVVWSREWRREVCQHHQLSNLLQRQFLHTSQQRSQHYYEASTVCITAAGAHGGYACCETYPSAVRLVGIAGGTLNAASTYCCTPVSCPDTNLRLLRAPTGVGGHGVCMCCVGCRHWIL